MILRKILLGFSVLAFAAAVTPAMADNSKSNGKGASHSTSAKGNGNSNGNGNGNGKSANHTDDSAEVEPSKGDLASELKGLNAVKANPNALENASPNSQVGRIAAYQDAALATKAIQEELDAANKALAALPVPERDLATIEADIALLDPAAAGYTDALAALEAERDAAIAYQDAVAALEAKTLAAETAQAAEDEALLSASGGRPLSDEAIAYIRDVLNI